MVEAVSYQAQGDEQAKAAEQSDGQRFFAVSVFARAISGCCAVSEGDRRRRRPGRHAAPARHSQGREPGENPERAERGYGENLNASLNTAFAPFLGSMVGLQKDRDYSGYAALGTELGALYVRDGMSEKEATAKAFNDLIGNRYDFRGTYRIPKSAQINPDDVQRGVYEATQEIQRVRNGDAASPFGRLQPRQNDLGVSDNEVDTRGGIARDGRFVTSPRNDGLNILVGTKFVKNQDGTPVLLHWDQLQKLGGSKEAAQAKTKRALLGSEQAP